VAPVASRCFAEVLPNAPKAPKSQVCGAPHATRENPACNEGEGGKGSEGDLVGKCRVITHGLVCPECQGRWLRQPGSGWPVAAPVG